MTQITASSDDMTTENSRADALTQDERDAFGRLVASASTFPDHNRRSGPVTRVGYTDLQTVVAFVKREILSPVEQPAAAPIEASGLTDDLLDQIRGDFEEAFQLIFSAYSVPEDRYNSDREALFVKRGKIMAAITPLQRVRAILTAPQPAPAEVWARLTPAQQRRTSPENVSDVLAALHRHDGT